MMRRWQSQWQLGHNEVTMEECGRTVGGRVWRCDTCGCRVRGTLRSDGDDVLLACPTLRPWLCMQCVCPERSSVCVRGRASGALTGSVLVVVTCDDHEYCHSSSSIANVVSVGIDFVYGT